MREKIIYILTNIKNQKDLENIRPNHALTLDINEAIKHFTEEEKVEFIKAFRQMKKDGEINQGHTLNQIWTELKV